MYYVVSKSSVDKYFDVTLYYNANHDSCLSLNSITNGFTTLNKAKKYAKSLKKKFKKSDPEREFDVVYKEE